MKICFAASSGGHFEEIKCLGSIIDEHESFYLTEKGSFNRDKNSNDIYYVPQINRRELLFLPKLLLIFYKSLRIMLIEKPDYVISTGALATFPISLCAKILRKKVIYIESFARIEKPSLTGRLVYRFADLFIIQWKELKRYYPKATVTGKIF